ncbi:MAG TPA: alpha/beta fold hydrolase [Candidatus Dormibacteraeota bacterium]
MKDVRPAAYRSLLLIATLLLAACSSGGSAALSPPAATVPPALSASPGAAPTATTQALTPPPSPPYAIAALRLRPHQAGSLAVGGLLATGPGYTKRKVTWPSMGAVMTGVIGVPTGRGPFPVVVVNHGYVPAGQYYVGQDSSKYADPLASQGFLTVSPNYPGYAGSGPGEADVPPIVAEAISDIDLISALATLPGADPSRVAVAGHSNGGGVSLILLAADSRVRAAVLYAPVSSDMADNARKWWVRTDGGTGPLGSPDADPAAYAAMSPRGNLPQMGPPTLVMQGSADEQIPAAWTAATVAALQAAAIRTQFVSFPGALHNFVGVDLVHANALAAAWLRSAMRS